jgi:AAA+ superfamily predicted ATPase
MDRPTSKEMTMKGIVALTEETVRLIGEMVGELGRQIAEWKQLAEQASPPVSSVTGELRRDTEQKW